MRDLLDVGPRDHAHGPALDGALRERDPRGHHVRLAQAPVGRVLVPRHEGRVARLLDEEARAPAEQVRAEDVLDRIEDAGIPDQPVEPREQEMALLPELAAERPAVGALHRLEPGAIAARLLGREHADRKVEPVATIPGHRLGQEALHGLRCRRRLRGCQGAAPRPGARSPGGTESATVGAHGHRAGPRLLRAVPLALRVRLGGGGRPAGRGRAGPVASDRAAPVREGPGRAGAGVRARSAAPPDAAHAAPERSRRRAGCASPGTRRSTGPRSACARSPCARAPRRWRSRSPRPRAPRSPTASRGSTASSARSAAPTWCGARSSARGIATTRPRSPSAPTSAPRTSSGPHACSCGATTRRPPTSPRPPRSRRPSRAAPR